MSQKSTTSQKSGRQALRGALGEDSTSEVSVSTNGNSPSKTPSPNKRASPRKAVGKENTTPKNKVPITKRKPTPKNKQKAPPASTSKAGPSRGKPAQASSEESEDDETPRRARVTKATVAQKKSNKAPAPPESDSDDEDATPEPQNRSGRSHVRQPRAPSSPTPRPVGRQKVPVTRSPAPRQAPATKRPVGAAAVKKPTGAAKRKQGVPVLREMQRLQSTVDCQIPRAPFSRLVRELMQRAERRGAAMRITPQALEALRESSESYLVQIFSDAYLITLNRKQVTLAPRDVQLLMFIRGPVAVRAR